MNKGNPAPLWLLAGRDRGMNATPCNTLPVNGSSLESYGEGNANRKIPLGSGLGA